MRSAGDAEHRTGEHLAERTLDSDRSDPRSWVPVGVIHPHRTPSGERYALSTIGKLISAQMPKTSSGHSSSALPYCVRQ